MIFPQGDVIRKSKGVCDKYYSINLDMSMSNKPKTLTKSYLHNQCFPTLVLTKKTASGRRNIQRGGQKDSCNNILVLLMGGQLLPNQINVPLDDIIKQDQV